MMDFYALAHECAPQVHPTTMAAVVHVESSFNPYAIGVVGGRLARQPQNKAEAVATAKALAQAGWNFSVGAGQVNRYNLPKFGLNYDTAFEPCANLRAGSRILKDCYDRASSRFANQQQALQAAFSCYYSGNFSTGFKPDFKGQPSYVQKVLASAMKVSGNAIAVVPAAKAQAKPAAPAKAAAPAAVPQAVVPAAAPGAAAPGEVPVALQAAPALPKKPRNIPAKYDGFSQDNDDTGANPYDGFANGIEGEKKL